MIPVLPQPVQHLPPTLRRPHLLLQDVEEEVFLLKKDIARMKEDTEEDIVLLKRDNARMRVELEQNWEELETLQALVEAMHEDWFPTALALCDPAVPSPVE